eukprot:10439750-Alexandrium_andersonii.AAC.1
MRSHTPWSAASLESWPPPAWMRAPSRPRRCSWPTSPNLPIKKLRERRALSATSHSAKAFAQRWRLRRPAEAGRGGRGRGGSGHASPGTFRSSVSSLVHSSRVGSGCFTGPL